MDRTRLSRFINQPLSELQLDDPIVVPPAETVRSAVDRMHEGGGSCVLVVDGGRLSGIFTERDVLKRCLDNGFDWDQPVGSLATKDPGSIAPTRSIAEAIATFQRSGYRTLPVVDGGAVVGLIRVGDVLRHIAEAFPEEVLNLPPRPHQVMERPEGG
jgi:CBS domain-containing protein